VACIVALLALAGCHRAPAESRIREAIQRMAQAAERDDAGALVEPLTADFDGNGGELDRQRLGGLLRLLRLRGEHAGVAPGPIDLEPRGSRWVATVTVTLTGHGSGLLPEEAGVYRVESAWREEGGEWRCYSASWRREL